MVTPEITMPLQAGEGKPGVPVPLPFLVPVTPGSHQCISAELQREVQVAVLRIEQNRGAQ